uniref:Uncharacterized protein n=1 Tax=Cucumis melo TaxID=3656 RepID=A0A9I9D1L8_CUCME
GESRRRWQRENRRGRWQGESRTNKRNVKDLVRVFGGWTTTANADGRMVNTTKVRDLMQLAISKGAETYLGL